MVSVQDMNRRVRGASQTLSAEKIRLLAYGATALLALTALYMVFSLMVGQGRVMLDNVRYGTPRTFHLSADVGHGEAPGMMSHFIAMNLDRQVVVIDIPGGDPDRARTIVGPYLFGADEHLTPVTLDLEDMNGDGHVDLIVNAKDEHIVYLNRNKSFELVSAQERQDLVMQQSN